MRRSTGRGGRVRPGRPEVTAAASLIDQLQAGPLAVSTLHDVGLADGSRHDIQLADGRVSAVVAARTLPIGAGSLDLAGYVITAAAADAHAHLDKALSIEGLAGHHLTPAYGNLHHAIDQWRVISESADEADYHRRARAAALELLGNGVTAVRSHCNLVEGPDPFIGLRALARVRDELRPVMDIEIAVLPAPWSSTADIVGAMEAARTSSAVARISRTTRMPSWIGWWSSPIDSRWVWTSTPTSS